MRISPRSTAALCRSVRFLTYTALAAQMPTTMTATTAPNCTLAASSSDHHQQTGRTITVTRIPGLTRRHWVRRGGSRPG